MGCVSVSLLLSVFVLLKLLLGIDEGVDAGYHYQHSGDHGAIGLALLASGQHECLQHNKSRHATPSHSASNSVSGASTPSQPRTPVSQNAPHSFSAAASQQQQQQATFAQPPTYQSTMANPPAYAYQPQQYAQQQPAPQQQYAPPQPAQQQQTQQQHYVLGMQQ